MFPRRPRCAPRPARMLPRRSRLHKCDLRMFPRRPCTATSTARMFPRPRHGTPFPRRARLRRGNIYRMFLRRPCHPTIGAGETFSGRMADGETFRAAGTGKHFSGTFMDVSPSRPYAHECCPVDLAHAEMLPRRCCEEMFPRWPRHPGRGNISPKHAAAHPLRGNIPIMFPRRANAATGKHSRQGRRGNVCSPRGCSSDGETFRDVSPSALNRECCHVALAPPNEETSCAFWSARQRRGNIPECFPVGHGTKTGDTAFSSPGKCFPVALVHANSKHTAVLSAGWSKRMHMFPRRRCGLC